ncbi:APC family permease [Longispora albida]|uniref:APC family permease n=1 Tax=Longispora albida TaxID=203523 RepID=UPI0003637F6B|nr:APC family permease [Longispora albida]
MASPSLERFGYTQELRRSLTFTDLLFYGLIFMVPIAPFGIFGGVYQRSGGMVALAYAIGAVAMMFTALSYVQMSRAFPVAGSVYSYAGRGIAPPVGFLAGWAILLDYLMIPGLLYLIASVAMHSTIPAVPIWLWLVGFVVVNTAVNLLGIKLTATVTKVLLAGELIVLAIFLAVGIGGLLAGKGTGKAMTVLYNGDQFSWSLILGAVSVAALSFLGFDGIAMLAEENKEEERQLGRSMIAALGLAGLLFIVQTWVASMFVKDPAALIKDGDPAGTAFYDAAEVAGGHWLAVLTAVTTAIAWGFADSLVAQVATSRLIYAMARDRQLPRFLAKISVRRGVPANAVFLVSALSLALGLYVNSRADGIPLLSSLINFGALIAFGVLHISVIWHHVLRNRSRDYLRHLVLPLIGFGILAAIVFHADLSAIRAGLAWLGAGVVILVILYLTGRKPKLSGMGS